MYPSSSQGRRKLSLSIKTLFYFESLFYSYPVFEGRLSRPIEHTIYSTFQPCLLNYSTMTSKGKKRNGLSKQRTHLLDSKRMFDSLAILWHCHAMLGVFFPVLAPAKRALFIPHTLAKCNWQNPQPAKRSTLVKPVELNYFSAIGVVSLLFSGILVARAISAPTRSN